MTDAAQPGPNAAESIETFGVVAEVAGRAKPLVLLSLTFARLIDDVVKPYDEDEPFFIDGVPLSKKGIARIKILKLGKDFSRGMRELERGLTLGEYQNKKVYGDQYDTRFEHILRTGAEDVTSQVIKAYNQAVKPKIADYLPKREELIGAATQIFVEAMKSLAH